MNTYKKNAYTIVELLIVIAIISGLVTLFLATYPASQRRSRDALRRNDIKQYQSVLEVYAGSHNNLYFNVGPPAEDLANQCGATELNLTAAQCQNDADPLYPYQILSTTTSYVIWARLEQPNNAGTTVYFIACSNGATGESATIPTSAVCPASF
jgi:prepilin-type N-terminal cleavage/methylation domain-containing protein